MSAGQQGGQGPQPQGEKPVGQSALERAGDPDVELNVQEERSALDWLLGAPKPAHYHVTIDFDTPEGLKPLRVNFSALDGKVLDRIEQSHISDRTGQMDKAGADSELFTRAVTSIEDPATGRKVDPKSEQFRKVAENEEPLASPIDALNVRFGLQPGLVAGVASAIREAAGWKPDRVGQASRVLVEAAGN